MNYVRRAEKKDIERLLKLLVQVDMVHHNGRPDLFRGPATKYNEEQLEMIVADDKTPVFVCVTEDDYVLGHAFCIHRQVINDSVLTDVKTLYIDDICVDDEYRRQGVGKMLYDHVIEFAQNKGYYNVTLNVWACNQGAMDFYQSLGMKSQKVGMEYIL